jgi:hypothetical protein
MTPAHGNLSDPEYEPTDEELGELVRSAFAGVRDQNEAALRRVHAEIATLRAGLMQRLLKEREAEPTK